MAASTGWGCVKRDDEHKRICTNERPCEGSRPPGCRRRRLLGDHGAQLLAFLERHDAVAGACALPDDQRFVRSQFCADRADYLDHAADFVIAAARRRVSVRPSPAALFAGGRNGRDLDRPSAAGERRQLFDAGAGGGAGWFGIGGLSPRGLARCADGFGWKARPLPIVVSGWRQYRLVAGTASRRFHRDPEGSVEYRLVHLGGAGGDVGAVRRRQLVPQRAHRAATSRRSIPGRAAPILAAESHLVGGYFVGGGVFEILLHGEP